MSSLLMPLTLTLLSVNPQFCSTFAGVAKKLLRYICYQKQCRHTCRHSFVWRGGVGSGERIRACRDILADNLSYAPATAKRNNDACEAWAKIKKPVVKNTFLAVEHDLPIVISRVFSRLLYNTPATIRKLDATCYSFATKVAFHANLVEDGQYASFDDLGAIVQGPRAPVMIAKRKLVHLQRMLHKAPPHMHALIHQSAKSDDSWTIISTDNNDMHNIMRSNAFFCHLQVPPPPPPIEERHDGRPPVGARN